MSKIYCYDAVDTPLDESYADRHVMPDEGVQITKRKRTRAKQIGMNIFDTIFFIP